MTSNNSQEPNSSTFSSQAHYQDLFLRLLDPAFLIHRDEFKILECNDACERVLEKNTQELIGLTITDFTSSDRSDEFAKKLRISKRKYYPSNFDMPWNLHSGKQIVMNISSCNLKLANEEEVIQVIARDVTQEREAEEKIQRYVEELRGLNEKLEALSVTDEMTKLFNFRHFKNLLKAEHERCERHNGKYAIVFCDVDNFKHYNDRNGHPAGDELLRQLAQILRSSCRKTDIPARYGGEEFAVLCSQADSASALGVAERIRESVQNFPFACAENQPKGYVSLSIGVANYPGDAKDFEAVLKSADEALYHSKHTGKNKVTIFDQVPKKDEKAA